MVRFYFRKIIESDYRPLAEILDEEWKFHLYSKSKGLDMAEYYLFHCLDGANEAMVLAVDGRPDGIVIIREVGEDRLDFSKDLQRCHRAIEDDPSFERCIEDLKAINDQYEIFARDHKTPDQAELRLVIISERDKGMGLGRILIDEALRMASSRGKRGLFFFTDTDCNYGFYDHIGAVREAEAEIVCMGMPLGMFAYRLDCRQ